MISDLIVDVGFHTGQDSDFYLKKGFRVLALEANPLLVEAGSRRFADAIRAGRLLLLNLGVADLQATLPFYVHKELSEWSSFDKSIGTTRGDYDVIDVPVVALRTVLEEHGVPYYLKIDIEGYDLPAMQSLRDLADKPKYISGENGDAAMINELYAQGYRRFKFLNQATISDVRLAPPAREGVFVEHVFPFGASGPFGEETEGPWLDRDAVMARSHAYWSNPQRDANVDGWFDLHATF